MVLKCFILSELHFENDITRNNYTCILIKQMSAYIVEIFQIHIFTLHRTETETLSIYDVTQNANILLSEV